ncbi:MAG TPA: hypothetical protein PLJ47_00490 [Candidatus Hydrogenedentes bacterium]|nr:hypothetical protein [Candidatus Hydrogenedentota bacterium]
MTADTDWMFSDAAIETTRELDAGRLLKRRPKHRKDRTLLKQEALADVLTTIPAPGESWHLVSNAKFDFFSCVAVIVKHLGGKGVAFHGSTWTMSRSNVTELLSMFDAGAISSIAILTGTYFKRRETSVYATLLDGLQARGQRYVAFSNHAKVMLLANDTDHIVIEGSANFTANPRLEQYVITNDRDLYEFHRSWMDHFLP